MANKTINGSSIPISKILVRPLRSSSIKLLDYVVDPNKMTDGYFESQDHAAYIFQTSLEVDIDEAIKFGVEGYRVKIRNPSTKEILGSIENKFETYNTYFHEDFPDAIDTGENDLLTIRSNIRDAQTILLSQRDGNFAGLAGSELSVRPEDAYIEITSNQPYSNLCKDMILDGYDPGESAALTMPVFAKPEETCFGFVEPSNSGIITYKFSNLSERLSLNEQREKQKRESKNRQIPGYRLEQSITMQSPTSADIVLGNFVKVKNSIFKSIRRIEVPQSFVKPRPGKLEFIFSPILKSDDSHEDIHEGVILENDEVIEHQFNSIAKVLFTPEIAPKINVLMNQRGRISYNVSREDPSTRNVWITKKVFNALTGMIEHEGSQKIVFPFSTNTITVEDDCRKFEPYVTSLVATAETKDDSSVSSTTILNSHRSQEYRGGHITNNVAIFATNVTAGINVFIDLNGTLPLEVSLYREDMSLPKTSKEKVKKVETFENPMSDLSFIDGDVISEKWYRYFTIQKFSRHGSVIYEDVLSKDDEIILRRNYNKTGLYECNVENTNVSVNSRRFRPTATLRSGDFETLQQSLGRYSPRILTDDVQKRLRTSILSDLPIFLVERVNRKTGQRSTLGTIESGREFKDDTLINLDDNFSYIFKLCLIDPTTVDMFSDEFYESGTDAIKNFTQAFLQITGATPVRTMGEVYQFNTGNEVIAHSPPVLSKSIPHNLTSNVLNEGYAYGKPSLRISWRIKEEERQYLDGFFVICRFNENDTVIGSIPGNPYSSENYSFIDTEFYNQVGTKEYYVITRWTDFTLSKPSNTISAEKESSESSNIMNVSTLTEANSAKENYRSLRSLGLKMFGSKG